MKHVYHYHAFRQPGVTRTEMDGVLMLAEPVLSVDGFKRAKQLIAEFNNVSTDGLVLSSLSFLGMAPATDIIAVDHEGRPVHATETLSNPSVKPADGQAWDREAVPCADARINTASELSACDHSVVMSATTMDAAYQRRWCAKCGATV